MSETTESTQPKATLPEIGEGIVLPESLRESILTGTKHLSAMKETIADYHMAASRIRTQAGALEAKCIELVGKYDELSNAMRTALLQGLRDKGYETDGASWDINPETGVVRRTA